MEQVKKSTDVQEKIIQAANEQRYVQFFLLVNIIGKLCIIKHNKQASTYE